MPETRQTLLAAGICAALAVAAGAGGIGLWRAADLKPAAAAPARGALVIAPMVSIVEPCLQAGPDSLLAAQCTGPDGSAAALVESTLQELDAGAAAAVTAPWGQRRLGYTLPVPLLGLFEQTAQGWQLDQAQIGRVANTIRDNDRPVVLYLFSTHFSAQAPIEAALAGDARNLAATRDGPLPTDQYYGAPLYNWSVARLDNDITRRREQSMQAVLDALCRLEPAQRGRIQAITLLGELHHLFPNFQAGMGFEPGYRVSDYSQASVLGFRAHLRERFGGIDGLNRQLGTSYAGFDDIEPPARDIRTEPLTDFAQHIDAFAHGTLPIAGWLHEPAPGPHWVRIYLNGRFLGRTPVGLARQDVLAARPAFGTADVGWRWDLDFRSLAPGLHRIDVVLERPGQERVALGTRQIAVMDRRQQTPEPVAQSPAPQHLAAPAGLQFHIDQPQDLASYYYNPLVPLWHRFRGEQIVRYLQHFDRLVAGSCFADTPRYSHQIVPFANPSWDANKFAVGPSLEPGTGLQLGVSLYGEASYGSSFFGWHAKQRHRPYGITEFHPLRPLDAKALQQVLSRHAGEGAAFLSFFVEPRWQGALVAREHNMFSFDPDNPQFGSDALYRAMQQLLTAGQ